MTNPYQTALLISAIAYGYIEAIPLYGSGWQPPDNNTFLKYFSRSYHIPLFFVFLGACIAVRGWYLLPLGCLIEDASYFFFSKDDKLTDKSWITGGLGGVTVFGQFIPYTYIGLVTLTGLFYWLNTLI